MKFNTTISAMMEYLNAFGGKMPRPAYETLLQVLNPFAPHLTEEMWEKLGQKGFCSLAAWPEYDEALTVDDEKEIAVQVCGKLKGTVVIPAGAEEDAVWDIIQANAGIMASLEGKQIIKKIYIKDKIFNVVAK
jgi:leucyl-tRNA synthetase